MREIRGRVVDLGGVFTFVKGLGRTWHRPTAAVVEPHAYRTRFLDYPESGVDSVFVSGSGYRQSFAGWKKWRLWSPADAAYFFGYALATYWSLPFILLQTKLIAHDEHSLTVDFPPELESHCRRQRFVFDDTGLLVRHDYRAEVFWSWGTGAHFSRGYVTVGGLELATERQVYARLGRLVLPLPLLHARITDFEVS